MGAGLGLVCSTVATLTAFRHCSLSESFPKRGRIDWVGSQAGKRGRSQ
jgi:hypothetical protein